MSRHIDKSVLSRRAAVGAIIGSAISAAGLATSGCGTTVVYTPPRPPPIPPAPPRHTPVPRPTPVKVPRPPEPTANPPRLVSRLKPVYDSTLWSDKPGGLLPGCERVFLTDRAWRRSDNETCAPYDMARWERYVQSLPPGALLIVDEECLHDSPFLSGREKALPELQKHLELHRMVRRLRPDVVNSDCCGPLPQADQPAYVWNDAPRLAKLRESNDQTMPNARPLLRALTVEVYFTPRVSKPIRASYREDVASIIAGNAAEARRVAGGLPIYALVWLRSKGEAGRNWSRYFGDDVARFILDESIRLFDGIVLWDRTFTPEGADLGTKRFDPADPAIAMMLKWLRERDR